MSITTFNLLCLKYNIAPPVALEHDGLRAALSNHDAAEVERILLEEF